MRQLILTQSLLDMLQGKDKNIAGGLLKWEDVVPDVFEWLVSELKAPTMFLEVGHRGGAGGMAVVLSPDRPGMDERLFVFRGPELRALTERNIPYITLLQGAHIVSYKSLINEYPESLGLYLPLSPYEDIYPGGELFLTPGAEKTLRLLELSESEQLMALGATEQNRAAWLKHIQSIRETLAYVQGLQTTGREEPRIQPGPRSLSWHLRLRRYMPEIEGQRTRFLVCTLEEDVPARDSFDIDPRVHFKVARSFDPTSVSARILETRARQG